MRTYVIRSGDYLTKLAHTMGFDAEAVWSHPKNAELKKLRRNKDLLCAGDLVFVPDTPPTSHAVSGGTTNKFSATVPEVKVELQLHHDDGPLANEPYTVTGAGLPKSGTSDGSGKVTLTAPLHTRELTLTLHAKAISYRVMIGDLDPIEESSGVKQRLTHLGYLHPFLETVLGVAGGEGAGGSSLAHAIRAFQHASGIAPTGVACEATQRALAGAHGL